MSRKIMGIMGENEFMHLCAFLNHPVCQLKHNKLYKNFDQINPPDFIINFNGESACVEVKTRNGFSLCHEFSIKASSVDFCIKFQKKLRLGLALIAIKRFESWYLVDANELKCKSKLINKNYVCKINSIKNLLDINKISLDLGTKKYFNKIPKPDFDSHGLTFNSIQNNSFYFNNSLIKLYGEDQKVFNYIYNTTKSNLIKLIESKYYFNNISNIVDMCPNEFSIWYNTKCNFKNKPYFAKAHEYFIYRAYAILKFKRKK